MADRQERDGIDSQQSVVQSSDKYTEGKRTDRSIRERIGDTLPAARMVYTILDERVGGT